MIALAPAFANPALATQAVFRAVMDAMARPGTIRSLAIDLAPPAPLSPGAAAVALALADYEAPLWLDSPLATSAEAVQWLRFHTGARIAERPEEAAFALISEPVGMPPLDRFAVGSMDYPDRSTTIVLQVESFSRGATLVLSGPGIPAECRLAAAPLPRDIAARLVANRALFPRGIDLVFTTGGSLAALPRSTRVAQGG